MRANDVGWPTFDEKFVNYPKFKRDWRAYRQTYHDMEGYDLVAKTLREKWVSGEAQKIGNAVDLAEIWDIVDTCYERPAKYVAEALKPSVEFRKYKMADSATIREFYSLLRAHIKSARTVGHLKLLISGQTIPNIMGKIPHTYFETMGNL
jgi:hypothetical protein